MGIFSFLNRDHDYDDIDLTPAEPAEEEKEQPDLPDIRVEMSIEVMGEDGKPLNSGRVTAWSKGEMTLGRHPGGLSFKLCEPGDVVNLRGCDSKMVQFFLKATVVESSRIQMKLKDLEPAIQSNHRENFRLMVSAPISIYYYNDETFKRPERCTLVDISTGGCCFMSEYLHGEGEVLRLKIKLEDYVAMDFVGEVIRVVEKGPSEFQCGVLFAELTKEETESLTKMLFNLQLGNRREHSRSEQGHW